MSCIEAVICIANLLGFILSFLDALAPKFSAERVSDHLLTNARSTRSSHPSIPSIDFDRQSSQKNTPIPNHLRAQSVEAPAELRGAEPMRTMPGSNATTSQSLAIALPSEYNLYTEAVSPAITANNFRLEPEVAENDFEKQSNIPLPASPCVATADTSTRTTLLHGNSIMFNGFQTPNHIDVDPSPSPEAGRYDKGPENDDRHGSSLLELTSPRPSIVSDEAPSSTPFLNTATVFPTPDEGPMAIMSSPASSTTPVHVDVKCENGDRACSEPVSRGNEKSYIFSEKQTVPSEMNRSAMIDHDPMCVRQVDRHRRAFSRGSIDSALSSHSSTATLAADEQHLNSAILGEVINDEPSFKELSSNFGAVQVPSRITIQVGGANTCPRDEHKTNTSSIEAHGPQPSMRLHVPQAVFLDILYQEVKRKQAEVAAAKAAVDRQLADQNRNSVVYATSRGMDSHHVHAYRPNLHTIAALVMEERNTADVVKAAVSVRADLDTAFLPHAVQQHEKLKNDHKEMKGQGSGNKGKKTKKSRTKTGRMNKERLRVEKALQSANSRLVPVDDIAADRRPKSPEQRERFHEIQLEDEKSMKPASEGHEISKKHDIEKSLETGKSILSSVDDTASIAAPAQVTDVTSSRGEYVVGIAHEAGVGHSRSPSPKQVLAAGDQEHRSSSTCPSEDHDSVTVNQEEVSPALSKVQRDHPLSFSEMRFRDLAESAPCGQAQLVRDDQDEDIQLATVQSTTNKTESVNVNSPSDAGVSTPTTLFDLEAHVHTLLTRSTPQQQQHTLAPCNKQQQAFTPSFAPPAPPPPPPYHNDVPRQSYPEMIPYYQTEPVGLYPFPDQLPEYFQPYYDYDPYAGFPQHQYYEPSHCHQSHSFFEGQVPHWIPYAPAAPSYSRAPIPGEPEGIKAWCSDGNGYGNVAAAQKPWYLQPLVYEEEKEREFEQREPSQRMRLMRVCRKYGL